jgi:hypothetical protein
VVWESLEVEKSDNPFAGLLGEGLTQRLERWVADARVEEAVRQRTRERWLAQQATEEATLKGVLVDLAERGADVALQLRSGGAVRGRVRVLGIDFVALEVEGGVGGAVHEVLIALREVSCVRTQPGEPLSSGENTARRRLLLVEAITGLTAERQRVVLALSGGHEVVAGTLLRVGHDVVVVRVDGSGASTTAYVAVGAIAQVSTT